MLLGTGCHLTWTIHTHGDDVAAATMVNPIDGQALEQFTKSGSSKGISAACLQYLYKVGQYKVVCIKILSVYGMFMNRTETDLQIQSALCACLPAQFFLQATHSRNRALTALRLSY